MPGRLVRSDFDLSSGASHPELDLYGWYGAEPEGRWSRAEWAEAILAAPPGTGAEVLVEIRGRVFGTAVGGRAWVRLALDDGPGSEIVFENDDFATGRAVLRYEPCADRPRNLRLSLVRLDPVSPAGAGQGGDERKIGVLVRSIGFQWSVPDSD